MAAIFGLMVLALLLWALNSFAQLDPRKLAKMVRKLGGVGILGGAVFLAVRGEIAVAVPLGLTGLGMLGLLPFGPAGMFQRTSKSAGQVSRVRSNFLEMELDHDTGAMRGSFIAGPYQGMNLDAVEVPKLAALLPDLDQESGALLMAYLDRRAPAWREDLERDAASRPGSGGGGGGSSKMTEEEAYQVLGLQSGASADDISRAHRTLMKKLHPDQGGSTYLAARVNQAKDVLLRRHG